MDDDLDQLLKGLKLRKIREILDEHLERAENDGPSYTEFLRALLRTEYQTQQERFLGHRVRRAKLPEHWALESFPWERQPGVQRAAIEQLARLDFMDRAGNLVLVGPTGVGKTGLSIGILLKALRAGHRGLFVKAQDLFDEMYASLADRSSRKLLNRLSRIELLVIDELAAVGKARKQRFVDPYGRRPNLSDGRHRMSG